MVRKTKEEWKVFKNVFDNFTLQTLHKFESQGHYDHLQSPLKIGKESNVFTAIKSETPNTPIQSKQASEDNPDQKIIVKIYRLESCNFNQMYNYLKQDRRFINLKSQRRKIIFAWVMREYRNLLKAREVGIRVPLPITAQNNVILMEHIGDHEAAPQLKDQHPEDPESFFQEIIEQLTLLYKEAKLVHGDLSGFNILNYNEKPVLIDFSQGTDTASINAHELLKRDLKNLGSIAKKCKYNLDEEAAFNTIAK